MRIVIENDIPRDIYNIYTLIRKFELTKQKVRKERIYNGLDFKLLSFTIKYLIIDIKISLAIGLILFIFKKEFLLATLLILLAILLPYYVYISYKIVLSFFELLYINIKSVFLTLKK